MPVQEQHPHQGRGVGGVGLDVSWLTIPKYGYTMNLICYLIAVGESSPAYADEGQSQFGHQCGRQGQKPIEAGIYDRLYIPRLP